jgi:hypothetical protein
MVRRGIGGTVAGVVLLGGVLSACHEPESLRSVRATAVIDQMALDFGEVPVGEWREKEIVVRNMGQAPFTLMEALQLADNPSYHVEAPQQLVPSWETRRVRVRFHPLQEGPLETQVKVATDAFDRPDRAIPVRGVGTAAPIRIEPSAINFETLEVASDRVLEATVENPVDIPMTVSIQGDTVQEFSSDVLTIPPFSTTTVKARFAPTVLGDRAARLEVLACPTCTPKPLPMAGRSVPHAFGFQPAPVPFLEIPVHETTLSYTEVTNITWRPVTISELLPSDPAFTALTDLAGRTLAPGETVHLDLQFAARYSGPNTGDVEIRYTSDRARNAMLPLDARGGYPQLALAPILIDFGLLPVGGKAGRTVRLTNSGANGNLLFQGVTGLSGNVDQFGVGDPRRGRQPYPWSGGAWPNLNADNVPIAPGTDSLDVPVFFQPTAAGEFQATIRFRSSDIFNVERDVVVKGTAYEAGACAWQVLPWPALDFGNVAPEAVSILGFRFENAGTNICAVKDIHISDSGGGAFWMPGGPLTGGVVVENDAFSAMIAFRPNRSQSEPYSGELVMTVSDPLNPTVRLPLRGVSQYTSCLVAAPSPINFGPIRYDCAPLPRTTYVSNACTRPVTVTGARIGPGTSKQFTLPPGGTPSWPRTLQPGEGFQIETRYVRDVLGQHFSPLLLDVQGEPQPFLIPMWAETNHVGSAIDRFVQGTSNEVDVLFVVSNTTTMQAFQQRLQSNIPDWVWAAEARGINLRVGVTTTGLVTHSASCPGGALGGEAGRLFPVDNARPRFVDAAHATIPLIQQNLDVGSCHNLVQGLETMRMALSSPLADHADDPRTRERLDGNRGFLRDSARLAVVFLVDEDDHSGFDPTSYAQFLDGLKGPNMSHRTEAHAIVPKDGCRGASTSAPRLEQLVAATGGTAVNICGDYLDLLAQILGRASGPQADFRLTFPARSPTEIEVLVNGAPVGGWHLDEAINSIVFGSGAIPSPGDQIEVQYVAECGTVPR